jgi:hypothetical protein
MIGTYEWLFLTNKYAIPNSKISHEIRLRLYIKLDLKMTTSMLLSSLIISRGDNNVIDYVFLNYYLVQKNLTIVVDSMSRFV